MKICKCNKCGGSASVYNGPTYNADLVGYYCSCDSCGHSVGDIESGDYSLTSDEAIKRWNDVMMNNGDEL